MSDPLPFEHIARPAYTIRAQRESDIEALMEIRGMPGVRHGTLAIPFPTLESGRRFFAGLKPQDHSLVALAGDVVVGIAGLHGNSNPRRAHAASVGICVHDDWQGKGVGTALFSALTDLADRWLNLRRLELNVYVDNAPAIALYRKFGFGIEGQRVEEAFRDGVFVDSYFMARLRPIERGA